jgi:hypothetical protein
MKVFAYEEEERQRERERKRERARERKREREISRKTRLKFLISHNPRGNTVITLKSKSVSHI